MPMPAPPDAQSQKRPCSECRARETRSREKRLDGHGFFRVHRGYLVNLSMVEEIESVSGGTLLLTLNGVEEKIPVSRRRVSSLKKALNL